MKTALKFAAISLCLILCLSSCSFINEVQTEAQKVQSFTEDLVGVIENPTLEEAEELVHPSSPLTPEAVLDKIQNNEKLQNLDPSGEIEIGEIKNLEISYHDKELGGNVYTAECTVTVDGTPIDLTLKLLSTDEGFGLYDFDIK